MSEVYRLPDVPGWYGWLQEHATPQAFVRLFITVEEKGYSVMLVRTRRDIDDGPGTILRRGSFQTEQEAKTTGVKWFADATAVE